VVLSRIPGTLELFGGAFASVTVISTGGALEIGFMVNGCAVSSGMTLEAPLKFNGRAANHGALIPGQGLGVQFHRSQ
jgi:hypothetical protein